MAGQRVGYLAGPERIVSEARKIGTHIYYHPPIVGQYSALAALNGGEEWIAAARGEYQKSGAQVAELLGLPAPDGGTFLFVPVCEQIKRRGMDGFLEDCFEKGVLVAPGLSCGQDYADWIRLSFTAVPPDEMLEAARRLAGVMSRA